MTSDGCNVEEAIIEGFICPSCLSSYGRAELLEEHFRIQHIRPASAKRDHDLQPFKRAAVGLRAEPVTFQPDFQGLLVGSIVPTASIFRTISLTYCLKTHSSRPHDSANKSDINLLQGLEDAKYANHFRDSNA
nr:unnamed protein product [Spirometra erinaceieuropaei]